MTPCDATLCARIITVKFVRLAPRDMTATSLQMNRRTRIDLAAAEDTRAARWAGQAKTPRGIRI